MTDRTCHFETLASRHGVSVQRCIECGGLVVHARCVSLRLEPTAFEALRAVLNDARRTLDGHAMRGSA